MDAKDLARIEYHRRYSRPDWRRFVRPDWERYVLPAHHTAMRKDFALRDLAFETPLARRLSKQNEAHEHEERKALEAAHQREIEHEALELKAELAALHFELVWAGFCSKAGYNPNQPRVPAGNPDGGRWGDGGEGRNDPRVISDATPDNEWKPGAQFAANNERRPPTLGHNNPPSDVPKDRPPDSRDRTAAIRAAGRFLAAISPPVARAAALLTIFEGASWLREHQAEIETQLDPPKSLEELQGAVHVDRLGTEKHHIVEQGPAEKESFPRSQIDAPDNLARIPKQKHQQISEWYSRKNFDDQRFGGQTPRDWLRGKSWEERRELGLEVLEKFGVLKR
jgi:hypothetical protein